MHTKIAAGQFMVGQRIYINCRFLCGGINQIVDVQ